MRLAKAYTQYQKVVSTLLLISLLLQSCGPNELLGDTRSAMRAPGDTITQEAHEDEGFLQLFDQSLEGGLFPEGLLSEDPIIGASQPAEQTAPVAKKKPSSQAKAHADRPPLPPSDSRKRRHVGTGRDAQEEQTVQQGAPVTSKRKVPGKRGERKKSAVKRQRAASMSTHRRLHPPSLPSDQLSRAEAQKGLSAYLERSGCCVLTGPSGVGKSTLASAYAHHHQLERKPVYWLKAQTDSQLLDELEHLATALDIHYHSLSQKHRQAPSVYVQLLIEQIYPKLQGAPTLLVIDNVSASSQAHVSLMLNNRPASVQVLVTMYGLSPCPSHASPMPLPAVSAPEAALYLCYRFALMDRPLETSVQHRLQSELGGLPHSLRLATGYLECHAHQSVGDYLDRLQALQQSKASTDESLLESQVELALEGLAESAQQLLRYSAYLSTEMIPRELLTSLVGDQAERCIDQLSHLSLVRIVSDADDADKRVGIQVPPLVQQVCRHYRGWQGAGAMEERALLERLVEVLLRHLPELEEPFDTRQAERFVYVPHAVSVAQASASVLGQSEGAAHLLLRTGNYKERVQGNFAEGLKHKEAGLSMLQALYPNQAHDVVARALLSLGLSHEHVGHGSQGLDYLTQALTMWQSLHTGANHADVAQALQNVGIAHMHLGNTRQGMRYLEQGLAMLRALHGKENHPEVARVMLSLGVAHQRLGNGEQELEYYNKALAILQALHAGANDADLALAMCNLGVAYQQCGDAHQGLDYNNKALAMLQALHAGANHANVALALYNVGAAHRKLGNVQQCLSYYNQALTMYQALHAGAAHCQVAIVLSSLSSVHIQRGDSQQGLDHAQRSLSMYEQLYPGQTRPEVAKALLIVGVAHIQLKNSQQGLDHAQRSLWMYEQLYPAQTHPETARALLNVGLACVQLGDARQGLNHTQRSLSMYEQLYPAQTHPETARALLNIGLAHVQLGSVGAPCPGLTYQERGLSMLRSLYPGQNKLCVAVSINSVGTIYEKQGDVAKALSLYREALCMLAALLPAHHQSVQMVRGNVQRLEAQ